MNEQKYWLPGETLRRLLDSALAGPDELDEELATLHLGLEMADGVERQPDEYGRMWRWDKAKLDRIYPEIRRRAVQASAAKVHRDQLS